MKKFKIVLFILLVFFLLGIGCVNAANDNDLDDLSLEDADFGPVQHDDVDFEELKTDDDGQLGQCESDSDRLDEPPLNLASLQNSITTCTDDIFKLEHNYSYGGGSDLLKGVEIHRDGLVIDGQGHSIDGCNAARIFYVYANSVTFKNIKFIGGKGYGASSADYYSGGAIFYDGGKNGGSTIDNCTFDQCTAYSGAAIYSNNRNLQITDSNFTNNNAQSDGGAVYSYGGGLIDNCIFRDNNAVEGGAIEAGNTKIANCLFVHNHGDIGGAIDALRGTTIVNNRFINNSAGRAGAVRIQEASSSIDISFFENNTATEDGGAVFINYGMGSNLAKVSNSTFINNQAKSEGGAVSGSFWLFNCSFTQNRADKNGGAIFNHGGTVTYSNFTNNTADNGGGIYSDGGELNHLNFEGNAANNGAGLYSTSGELHYLNFTGNDAAVNGGGVYVSSGRSVVECRFENNSAGNRGGALCLNGQSTINNVNFTNNRAGNGGAVYNNNVLTVNNTDFNRNNAYSGGAIQISKDLNLHNINFRDNSATDGTNHINLMGNVKLTLDNVTPGDVNPFKVSVISLLHASNGTAFEDPSDITVQVTSENKPLTEGFVSITLDDVDYTSPVVDGIGVINITGAGIGRYSCNITYHSYNYTVEAIPVDFYIVKKSIVFTVNITDIVAGETLKFNVTLADGENFNSGNMSTVIDNREYVESIVNGTASFEIPNLEAGHYDAFMYYGGGVNYYLSVKPFNFTVFKRNVSLKANASDIVYGNVLRVTANVTSDMTVVDEGFVSIIIDGRKYVEYVAGGTAVFEIPDLPIGDYVLNVTYSGAKNNANQTGQIEFSVIAKSYSVEVDFDNITYGDSAAIRVNVKNNGVTASEGHVFVTIDRKVYEKILEDGVQTFEISNLDAGIYDVGIVFESADNRIVSEGITLKVNPKTVDMKVKGNNSEFAYGNGIKITVDLIDDTGTVNSGTVTINLNGESYSADVVNGTATVEIPNLSVGRYDANVTFNGKGNYNNLTGSVTFNVIKQDVLMGASDDDFIINYDGKYSITLKDAGGMALSGKTVTFTFNGKGIGSQTTDSNGIATIRLTANDLKDAKSGKKSLSISFAGDDCYNHVSKTVGITVNKEKTKITAKNKKFKKSKKTKKYAITLKDSKGKAVKKVKVTLKVKGKTYKAKTNSKGKATFKISKLNKKGTFKAKIKFKANQYYKCATKKVKIKVGGR